MSKNLGNFSDIQASLAAVKDVQIDPNTGASKLRSNKSILENSGYNVKNTKNKKIKEAVEQSEEKTKEAREISDAYKKMMGESTITKKKQFNDPFIDELGRTRVVKAKNEDEYMKKLIEKVNKKL